jgi:predicted NAD/FAD-dependent oxidoreductase
VPLPSVSQSADRMVTCTAPELVPQGLTKPVSKSVGKFVSRYARYQAQGEDPVQGFLVLSDEDLRWIITNDRTRYGRSTTGSSGPGPELSRTPVVGCP